MLEKWFVWNFKTLKRMKIFRVLYWGEEYVLMLITIINIVKSPLVCRDMTHTVLFFSFCPGVAAAPHKMSCFGNSAVVKSEFTFKHDLGIYNY